MPEDIVISLVESGTTPQDQLLPFVQSVLMFPRHIALVDGFMVTETLLHSDGQQPQLSSKTSN